MSDALLSVSSSTREEIAPRLPLRQTLELFTELRLLERVRREAELCGRIVNDDQRALLSHALSLEASVVDPLFDLIDRLEARAATQTTPEVSAEEFSQLHSAFGAMPAQLHPAMLAFLDRTRAAVALGLILMPLPTAASIWPALCPLLLCPSAERAEAMVSDLLARHEHLRVLIEAYRELPLSSRAAATSELPSAALALSIIVAGTEIDPEDVCARHAPTHPRTHAPTHPLKCQPADSESCGASARVWRALALPGR